MKKTIHQRLVEAEARLAAKAQANEAQEKTQESALNTETVPEAPEKVMQRLMEPAEETHLVRSERTGQFIKPRSDEAKLQRKARAEKLIGDIQDLLEAPQSALEITPEDSIQKVLIKTLIQDMKKADPDKQLGGKAKVAEALWKAARLYEKEEQQGHSNIMVVIPGYEDMKEYLHNKGIESEPNKKPLIRPSWAGPPTIDAEIVSEK
jgi:hypothetical protein